MLSLRYSSQDVNTILQVNPDHQFVPQKLIEKVKIKQHLVTKEMLP